MRFKSLFIIVALLIVGFSGYQYFPKPAGGDTMRGKPQGGFPVEAAKVRVGALKTELSTVGTFRPDESVMLRPEIAGRVQAIHLTEGARAKKGDLLIQMDDRMVAAELRQAEAAANLARVSYNRAKLLKEKGAGTVSNFDTMQAALRVTEAQVDLARAKLDKTRITAPFDGAMGLRKVSPGDYVDVGQDLAGFTNNNPMKADFTLPENATSNVAAGQEIDVVVDAIAGRSFKGKIYAIDPQIDEVSRNIALRAMVANDDGALKPGLFARISIITAEKVDTLFVPESAIMPRGNENFVMKVSADKKVASVPVTIGNRAHGEVEITSGLTAGDTVITAGHLKVKDGGEVSY